MIALRISERNIHADAPGGDQIAVNARIGREVQTAGIDADAAEHQCGSVKGELCVAAGRNRVPVTGCREQFVPVGSEIPQLGRQFVRPVPGT